MRPRLMYPDRGFDTQQRPPWNAEALVQDLGLDVVLAAMGGDATMLSSCRLALLGACDNDLDTIRYRQAALEDAIRNPDTVGALYAIAGSALEARRNHWLGIWGRFPSSMLNGSVHLMKSHVAALRELRAQARAHAAAFTSAAFRNLFAMLERELTDDYLGEVDRHLENLELRGGTPLSAAVGAGGIGHDYRLHRPGRRERGWLRHVWPLHGDGSTFKLAERDEAGAKTLSAMREHGIDAVARALAQAADHVDAFFRALQAELAFYAGCLLLCDRLTALGEPTCFPRVFPAGPGRLAARGLYDPALALQMGRSVVANDLDAAGKALLVVTGANQGGKSVFLRSLGVAQLMMQCGTFVAADSFDGEIASAVVTHYRREEDPSLRSGKLDEELHRVSEMADHLRPGGLVLLNESFAATNEREGSEIARQVVSALVEKRIRVAFVTHLHDFASSLWEQERSDALFLRAERRGDGRRSFRVVPAAPEPTSHARDVYARVFA